MPQNISANGNPLDETSPITPNLRAEVASFQESLNQMRTEMTLYRRRVERRQMEVDAHILRTNVLWAIMLLLIVAFGTAIAFGIHSGVVVVHYPASQVPSNGTPVHVASTAPAPTSKDNLFDSIPQSDDPQNQSSVQPSAIEPEKPSAAIANPNTQNLPTQRARTDGVAADSNPDQKSNFENSSSQLLADSVNRNRIDFVVTRNKTVEVAPGIFLTVRNTDVDRQQVNGWIQISEEGRTVWLRDQGTRKVMTFTKKTDGRSHELIFTRIGKDGVSGYLLVPMTAS